MLESVCPINMSYHQHVSAISISSTAAFFGCCKINGVNLMVDCFVCKTACAQNR